MKWKRWWNNVKAYSGAKFGIKTSSLGQLENVLRHSGEVNNPKQMASNKPILNTMACGGNQGQEEVQNQKGKGKGHNCGKIDDLKSNMVSDELCDEEA